MGSVPIVLSVLASRKRAPHTRSRGLTLFATDAHKRAGGNLWHRGRFPESIVMSVRTLVAALVFALAPLPLLAQSEIKLDQPVGGALSTDSPRADDNTPYELHVYRGPAGQRIRVTMDSDAFDAYLAVGTNAAPSCQDDCRTDDDNGDGTNAALVYTMPASGRVEIRANSIGSSDSGPYTLRVSALPAPRVQALSLNESVRGRLDAESPRDEDERPFQLYSIKGRPGQDLVIRLDSDEFDPVVDFGSWREGVFTTTSSDDDGGAGNNARLRVTLDRSGEGAIKAYGFSAGSVGHYTVRAGEPPAPRPIQVRETTIGESVRARLAEEDAFTPDEEIHFHVFRIQGRPGQRITARMESSDFDPRLRWGRFSGDTFTEESSDDDSGGGTSAQLTITLDEDGEGRLVATSFEGGLGQYVLSVVAAAR